MLTFKREDAITGSGTGVGGFVRTVSGVNRGLAVGIAVAVAGGAVGTGVATAVGAGSIVATGVGLGVATGVGAGTAVGWATGVGSGETSSGSADPVQTELIININATMPTRICNMSL